MSESESDSGGVSSWMSVTLDPGPESKSFSIWSSIIDKSLLRSTRWSSISREKSRLRKLSSTEGSKHGTSGLGVSISGRGSNVSIFIFIRAGCFSGEQVDFRLTGRLLLSSTESRGSVLISAWFFFILLLNFAFR